VAVVAAEAGVSPDTIYRSLGGKRGLLEGVYSAAIFDPEDPEQAEQRRRWESIEQLTDPLEVLRRLVERSRQRMARTSPVHAIIRGAADGDELAGELKAQMLRRRLESQALSVQTHLGAALRPGLSVEEACQRYSGLASPELYHLTTVDLGWSPQRYESWLFELLAADLLGRDA
jgi:AcrR family transcriptional regulator